MKVQVIVIQIIQKATKKNERSCLGAVSVCDKAK